jgi:hypothetical protein
VLRIDETSKTLVAPQAGARVTEASPEREELLALVGASWEPFVQEMGLPSLRLLATEPMPGVDLLAFDAQAGRAVLVQVTGETVEWQLIRTLQAAAAFSALDAAQLAALHEALEAVVPGDSPQLVVIAGAYDPRALATASWLNRRHGVDVSTYAVSVLRFGNERLLSVRREPSEGPGKDPAAEVQWMLTGESAGVGGNPIPVAPAVPAASSTPPPGA